MTSRYTGPRNPSRPIPDGEAGISIYGYTPSLALAIVGVITFALVLVAHGFYFFKSKRTRTFQFFMWLGCAMEVVGYGFRASSSQNPFVVIRFVIQYFMIVCAPVNFTTALYLSLSSAVSRLRDPSILPLRPKVLVATFVIIDVVTTALQVLGAAFIGVSESARARGDQPFIGTDAANNILLAGLAIQCFFFLIFLVILGITARRNGRVSDISASREKGSSLHSETVERIPRKFITILAITSALIWGRTIYRLAETAEGVFGYASTHEYLFGVFEYAPVIIALGIWAIFPLYKLLDAQK